MTKETYFEELSYALRRRELLPRPVEEDGLLPVEWNGRILCRVTESGAVRYDPTWVDTSRAKAALAQVTEAAGTVMEYMTILENAPPLKADGLADGYRVLAEFNGTVLAGTETLLGAQFVTWARDYDRSGVNDGHYYMEDYQGAREDFALRSGLVARERVFDQEQMEGLRQAVQGFLPAGVPMPAPPGSDHSPAAGKNPGSDAERKSRAWTVHVRAAPNQAPPFSMPRFYFISAPTSRTPRSTRRNRRPGRYAPAPPSAWAAPTPPTASSAGERTGSACARRCGGSMPRTGR